MPEQRAARREENLKRRMSIFSELGKTNVEFYRQ